MYGRAACSFQQILLAQPARNFSNSPLGSSHFGAVHNITLATREKYKVLDTISKRQWVLALDFASHWKRLRWKQMPNTPLAFNGIAIILVLSLGHSLDLLERQRR